MTGSVRGEVARGFEPVRDAFAENFRTRGEVGGACAVYLRGENVVDLWGGARDHATGAPWEEDTMVLVFSTTKGMSALALAVAHSRGYLDYEATVATYWPEFAQSGKGAVTVRQLLAHEAGLAVIDEPFDAAKLADVERMDASLAKQRPVWPIGRRHGYHAVSMGPYAGALLRHANPQRRTLGRFFQEEVAAPLGLSFHIGLPPGVAADRVARMKGFGRLEPLLHPRTLPWRLVLALANPRSLTSRAFLNPRLRDPADLDRPEWRAVELPGSNGIGTARSVARAYGCVATGGAELGLRRETLDALAAPAAPPPDGAHDHVLLVDTSFSLGFLRPCAFTRFGGDRAFGTPGMGGSLGFADPERGLGFAYVTNRMGFHMADDPREKALRDAMYRCLPR